MKNLNINKILLIIFVFIGVVLLYPNSVCAEEYDKVSNVVIFVKGSDDSRDIFNANTNWNLIEKMYNKNEMGSIDNSFKNYIKTISEGKLEVENYFPQESEDKLSVSTYTLSKSISEYKSSDSIVEEVIDAVKNSKISYNINSKLDNMNTSYLDNLTIIVQGKSDNSIIGSHKAEYSGTNKINGLSVSNYNIIPSADLVSDDGTTNVARYAQVKISHEFLHTLGLPDLYRKTDVGEPVGSWDIMANVGYVLQYPLSYLRYKQGWIGSNEITKSGTYTLDAVSGTGSNKLFILKTPLSDSEYIALEYRKKSTNLTDIESGIPNSGLLMYRINNKVEDSTNVRGKNYIYIYRPDVADKDSGNDLIESGDYKGFNKYYNATLSPEVGRTEYGSTDLTKSFTDNTLYYSGGQNSGIKISNVKYSDNKNQITFDVDFADYNEENLWGSIGVLSGNAYGSTLYKDKKNNLMYIAYPNRSGSSSKVSVKKINGNTLEQVGNEINDANYPSLAIYNNDLYIMTQNFNGYLEIYKLDGSTWTKISEYKTNYPKNAKLIESNSGLYAMYEETVSGYTTKLTIKDVINNKVIAEREAQDFGNPAVSFYNNKIYLAYSSYFGSDNSAKIESFDLTRNEWKVEKKLTINKSNIHSIKQYGNKLYILVGADGISPIVYTYDGTTWSEDKIDLMSNYSNLNMNIINDNIYISYINTKDNKSYLLKLSSHKSEIIDSNLGSDYSYLYTENDKENMYAITSDANSNSISIKTKKIESDNSNSSTDDKKNDNNNDKENIDKSKNGWVVENDNTYYYKDGKMLTGHQTIDGAKYYFDSDGKMHKTFLTENGKIYYYGYGTGQLKYGWSYIDDDRYYSDSNGVIQTGHQTIDGAKYYFDSDGKMHKMFLTENGKIYYYGYGTGQLKYGWSYIGDNTYYSDSNGVIQTGEQYIDGTMYKFSDTGVLQNGWQTFGGKTYYYYTDRTTAKGLVKIAGFRYLFSSSGELLISKCKSYVDLSKDNGPINWDILWASGEIDGVILKVSAGSNPNYKFYQENIKWFKNAVSNCERLGIPYGVYWYSYAEPYDWDYYSETEKEANQFISYIRGHNPTLGVYWDLEEDMTDIQYNIIVPRFMEIMNKN